MHELDTTAMLFFWPAAGEGETFPTLREALTRSADIEDAGTVWIITESGKILRPREIEALRADLAAAAAVAQKKGFLRGCTA